jgi:serine/threonine-protein kinase
MRRTAKRVPRVSCAFRFDVVTIRFHAVTLFTVLLCVNERHAAAGADSSRAIFVSSAGSRVAMNEAILGGEGGYHVLEKIAQGGMAEIFLARHRSVEGFQRQVVIKRILREFSANAEFVASFLNEAKLSAQLSHSNIVRIYDLGRSEGCYFIAMEYVRGFDLHAILAAQRKLKAQLPLPVVLTIMSDLCAGLGYAHAATDLDGRRLGLVHRDVTPSNVLVALDGQAKILDFGIAKATATGEHKTKTGTIKGKYSYLAPEQVLGHPVDHRADIFAAGVTLYELFTNRNPYRGPNEYETLMRVVKADSPSLVALRPTVPMAFDAIVRKALAKEPNARFQSCEELRAALHEEARSAGIAFSPLDAARLIAERRAQLEAFVAALRGPIETSDLSGKVLGLGGDTPPPILLEPTDDRPRSWTLPALLALAVIALFFAAIRPTPRAPAVIAPAAPQETVFEVASTPSGGAVLLDGTLLTGETPLTITGLVPGEDHAIEVRLAGHQPAVTRMQAVSAGVHSIQTTLAPLATSVEPLDKPREKRAAAGASARVRVVVIPWAAVTIDGKSVGETPIAPVSLAAGPHVIVMENSELKKRVVKRVNLAHGQDALVRENLTVAREE